MSGILTDDQVLTCIAIISSHSARAAIQAAAGLGAEIEREACAKECEERGDELSPAHCCAAACDSCADRIRARAGKEGG